MFKLIPLLALLCSCTVTCIKVRNDNGATSTVDASITADPNTQVDPDVSVPPLSNLFNKKQPSIGAVK